MVSVLAPSPYTVIIKKQELGSLSPLALRKRQLFWGFWKIRSTAVACLYESVSGPSDKSWSFAIPNTIKQHWPLSTFPCHCWAWDNRVFLEYGYRRWGARRRGWEGWKRSRRKREWEGRRRSRRGRGWGGSRWGRGQRSTTPLFQDDSSKPFLKSDTDEQYTTSLPKATV